MKNIIQRVISSSREASPRPAAEGGEGGEEREGRKFSEVYAKLTSSPREKKKTSSQESVTPSIPAKVERPKCYFCELPVAPDSRYVVKQARAMEAFLVMNPQWQSFGKVFDSDTILCDKGFCLAAAYENWRLDSFGVKSPRSPRKSPRLEPKPTPNRPTLPVEEDDASVATAQSLKSAPSASSSSDSLSAAKELLDTTLSPAALGKTGSAKEMSRSPSGQSQRAHVVPRPPETEAPSKPELSFLHAVEEKRKRLTILQNKGMSLDATVSELSQDISANRDERLRVAKRLQELRSQAPELELKKIAREKESILTRKRDLYERLLQARLDQASVHSKLERLDLEQQVSLMKLDLFTDAKDKEASEGDQEKHDKLKENIAPTLQHMQHIPEAKEIFEKGLQTAKEDKDFGQQSSAITQELQHALREAYTKSKEDLLEERRILTAGRFELEARLGQLKMSDKDAQNDPDQDPDDQLLNDNVHSREDDEPFDIALELAGKMDDIVENNMEVLTRRAIKLLDEKDWVEENPSSEPWQEIQSRMTEFRLLTESESVSVMNEKLRDFLATEEEYRTLRSKEKEWNVNELATMNIANTIISEVYNEWVKEYITKFLTVSRKLGSVLDSMVLEAICGSSQKEKDFLRLTGREYLLLGTVKDMRYRSYNKFCDNSGKTALYKVDVSQHNCINSNFTKDSGMSYTSNQWANPRLEWPLQSDCILSINAHIHQGLMENDFIGRESLMVAERMHWNKMALQRSRSSPLAMVLVPGRIEMVRLFSRSFSNSSLLVVGTHVGRFGCWTVPWTGAAPLLICVSPALPRQYESRIVDMREGSFNSTTLVCLYENGHVRVWDLNPISLAGRRQQNGHNWGMFPANVANFTPVVPSCIYHMNPLDLSLPLELDDDGKPINTKLAMELARKDKKKIEAQKRLVKQQHGDIHLSNSRGNTAASEHAYEDGIFGVRKKKLAEQRGSRPVVACFHPSFTISGRNPSLLIGTEGGNIMKMNMDFRVNDLDAPILHLPPFADVEYVHPQNAPDLILTTAKKRKGNKVYRELFHFHRSSIIFLGVIDKVSEKICSIDEEGYVAIWSYTQEYLKGLCWFEPIKTGILDINSVEYQMVAICPDGEQKPTASQLKKMNRRTRQRITKMETIKKNASEKGEEELETEVEVEKREVEYIQETYYPVTNENQRMVEFTSLTRKTQTNSDDGKGLDDTHANVVEPPMVEWSCCFVKKVINQTSIDHIVMCDDGTEIFFALSHTVANKLGKESQKSGFTDVITIVGLSMDTLEFRTPYPKFHLPSGQQIKAMTIGPINMEVLTRAAFIFTNSETRVFSLETGQELITSTFPYTNIITNLDPMLMALCPSQRVIAYTGPKSTRIDVSIFIHEDDGKEDDEIEKIILDSEARKNLRKPAEDLENLGLKTVLTAEVPPDLEYNQAKEEVTRFLKYCWNAFEIAVDRRDSFIKRETIARELFLSSDNLGFIAPISWPPDYTSSERKARLTHAAEKHREYVNIHVESESSSSDDDSKFLSEEKEVDDPVLLAYRPDDPNFWHELPPVGMLPYSEWDGSEIFQLVDANMFLPYEPKQQAPASIKPAESPTSTLSGQTSLGSLIEMKAQATTGENVTGEDEINKDMLQGRESSDALDGHDSTAPPAAPPAAANSTIVETPPPQPAPEPVGAPAPAPAPAPAV